MYSTSTGIILIYLYIYIYILCLVFDPQYLPHSHHVSKQNLKFCRMLSRFIFLLSYLVLPCLTLSVKWNNRPRIVDLWVGWKKIYPECSANKTLTWFSHVILTDKRRMEVMAVTETGASILWGHTWRCWGNDLILRVRLEWTINCIGIIDYLNWSNQDVYEQYVRVLMPHEALIVYF